MTKQHKGLLIGIAFAVVVTALVIWQIIDFPRALKEAKQLNDNANRLGITNGAVIGNVNVPPVGDPGKFQGKLETLALIPADFPTTWGAFTENQTAKTAGYRKVPAVAPEDKDTTQFYFTTQLDNSNQYLNTGVMAEASETFQTFGDTSAAAHFYASMKRVSEILPPETNQNISGHISYSTSGSFASIGDDNYFEKDWYGLDGTPSDAYATRRWIVNVLDSNMIATFDISLPYAATDDTVKSILQSWLQRTAIYQKGTAADVQAENASGI